VKQTADGLPKRLLGDVEKAEDIEHRSVDEWTKDREIGLVSEVRLMRRAVLMVSESLIISGSSERMEANG
jgi:hypothetical protein